MDKADTIRTFYDEYLAVNDLPAEFYLETVEKVFQTCDLAKGVWRQITTCFDAACVSDSAATARVALPYALALRQTTRI